MKPVHGFNDDLLCNEKDRQYVEKAWPEIFHVLDFPELRAYFLKFDAVANSEKKRARRAGKISVAMTMIALMGAACSPLYHSSPYNVHLATAFALLGIGGALIGFFGVLYGESKQRWLSHRLMTERLRQLHFQLAFGKLDEVAHSLSSPANVKLFQRARLSRLAAFQQRFESHLEDELHGLLDDDDDPSGIWLDGRPKPLTAETANALPESLFSAYRALRLQHQISYINRMLRPPEWLLDGSLLASRKLLGMVSLTAVAVLFVFDLAAAFGTPLHHPLHLNWFPENGLHIATVCLAIIALGCRAIEEGTQNRVEIARYRNYRNSVRALLERFETADSRQDQLEVIAEMERLTFLEMKAFLSSHDEASFVM